MSQKGRLFMSTLKDINQHVIDTRVRDMGGDPGRREVLELNQTLRGEQCGGLPDDLGYVALNIPVFDMRALQMRFPDLASLDADIQHRAWLKFLASPESAPYKLRKRDGKKGLANRHGVIVK
jgi:hypothetical protein